MSILPRFRLDSFKDRTLNRILIIALSSDAGILLSEPSIKEQKKHWECG